MKRRLIQVIIVLCVTTFSLQGQIWEEDFSTYVNGANTSALWATNFK